MVAALFVERDGAYFGLPDVDPWDAEREGKKETAALIYTAASEIARMRSELHPQADVQNGWKIIGKEIGKAIEAES